MSSTVIPCLRYRDARRMLDWLCEVFGSNHTPSTMTAGSRRDACPTDAGLRHDHARLRQRRRVWTRAVAADSAGTTQSPYVVVPDADEVYRRARAAGAEIVIEIRDEDDGGRAVPCRDPEGHLWNIGTYDPWRANA